MINTMSTSQLPKYTREECIDFLVKKCEYKKDENGNYVGTKGISCRKYETKEAIFEYRPSIDYYTKNLQSTKDGNTEKFYWLFNNITDYDQISTCWCGKKGAFTGLKNGYSNFCSDTHSRKFKLDNIINEQNKIIEELKLVNIADDVYSLEETKELCNEYVNVVNQIRGPHSFMKYDFFLKLFKSTLYYKKFLLNNNRPNMRKFKEAVHCVINDINDYEKCAHPNCNNKLRIVAYLDKTETKYCSHKCVSSDPSIKEIKKETIMHNYGVTDPFYIPEIRQKCIDRNKDPILDKARMDKMMKTNLARYGVRMTWNDKERIIATSRRKYGTDWPSQNTDVKLKTMETCLKKYGTEVVPAWAKSGKFGETELYYQGSTEKQFLEKYYYNNKISSIVRGPGLKYFFENRMRLYMVDFKIIYKNNAIRLVEVKGTHQFLKEEVRVGKFEQKMLSLIQHSKDNSYLKPLLCLTRWPEIELTEENLVELLKELNTYFKLDTTE